LPVIETQAGDVSAYIPTNVISITDGQIYLEPDLFYQGIRPAINAGLSVSRVGSSAQTKAMKKVAGKMRLEAAQYRDLAAFAQFGSDLDDETKAKLSRGERLVEIFKQDQYVPMSMANQVIAFFAVVNGFVDDVPVDKVTEFEKNAIEYVNNRAGDIVKRIAETGKLEDEVSDSLKKLIADFRDTLDYLIDRSEENKA
jgi:F-type H+-transporting ATPase subunit alpha